MSRSLPILVAALAVSIGGPSSTRADPPAAILSPLPDARIVIIKSQRRLLLYSGDEIVRTYPVGLGFEPVADKIREGDGATPEGIFHVCRKNPKSRFLLSLGLSYPSREDAQRGLDSGLISNEQFRAVTQALDEGRCPPWNTPLGGEIFIHGRGSATDWTLGVNGDHKPRDFGGETAVLEFSMTGSLMSCWNLELM